MEPLPIDAVLPGVIAALRANSSVVLQAPTGAGKTTRVPPALLDAELLGRRRVIVLEPRRVAARAAARRMAFERQCRLGDEIGYQVRFDRQWNRDTRVLVVTEGTLVRMLQDDPFLDDVAAVIFDEFHERNLDTDLSLGMVRRVQQTVRPDLKIVVMSATLGVEAVARFLGNCPVVVSEGRLFPVEVNYEPRSESTPLAVAVVRAAERVLLRTPGDLLVFLPGQREIRDAMREFEPLARQFDLVLLPLHGELPPEQQDAALAKQSKRKIVLATNVAETSVTVDGVTAVVDTGLARQLRFDPSIGLDRLELGPISQASAEQRAGRAGRQQPGVCVRLWSEASQRARPEQTQPEIRRVDLAGPVLQLRSWGEADVLAFPWFEPPRQESLERAESLLRQLNAINAAGQVTDTGHALSKLPVHPRLGRLLIEGASLGQADCAALAAALLSERDPFSSAASSRSTTHAGFSQSDLLDRIEALEDFERTGREETFLGHVNRGAAFFALQSRNQLKRLIAAANIPDTSKASGTALVADRDKALLRAVLAAFPDRLAKRREPNSPRALMVGGRGVRLGPQSRVTRSELFLCLDIEGSGSEATVRLASGVERAWLPEERLTLMTELSFDTVNERVQARRQVRWDDLVLEESPAPLPDDDAVADLLARNAAEHWERVRPADDSPAGIFLTRVRCLREWMPELELPAFDDKQLQELLPELSLGWRSLAELRTAPWLEFLQSKLDATQRQAVERDAPERIEVPSGSRIALQYEVGRPPVLAVRIQEIFGLRETPRVARGRVPVLLHLLAPSHRPQQITDDLASFWANAYPKIKSELRRRYPKHAWPDDPLTAAPERRPMRRRS